MSGSDKDKIALAGRADTGPKDVWLYVAIWVIAGVLAFLGAWSAETFVDALRCGLIVLVAMGAVLAWCAWSRGAGKDGTSTYAVVDIGRAAFILLVATVVLYAIFYAVQAGGL